jgi:hypothetical protein
MVDPGIYCFATARLVMFSLHNEELGLAAGLARLAKKRKKQSSPLL